MNFPSRRKPLALFFYYGFVGVLVGAYAADAQDQALAPLRVDPALLGQSPVAPAPANDGLRAESTRQATAAEAKPVESALVEARPVESVAPVVPVVPARPPVKTSSKASAQQLPSRAVAPQVAPPEAARPPVPAPSEPETPLLAPSPRSPRAAARQPTAEIPAAPDASASAPASSSPVPGSESASALPLSVDPVQLGVAPVKETTAAAPAPVLAQASGATPASAGSKAAKADASWFSRAWDPVVNAYDKGAWEFYLPFATYHSRSSYTQEQIDEYQERPLGFGVGKGLYNENGNWEGVYAMAFQDSHFKPSYTAGYGWKATWRPADDVRVGLGYLAGLMSREDVMNYVPFPIIVPLASVSYKNFSVEGTYIPPGGSAGNVLFLWAKWELGKAGEAIGTPARPTPVEPTLFAASGSPARGAAQAPARLAEGPTIDAGFVARSNQSLPGMPSPLPAATPAPAAADDLPALALRPAKALSPQPKESAVPRPIFLAALRMGGDVEREFNAEGDAELRKIGTVVNADRLTYWPIDDEVEAEGQVRLELDDDLITGPLMRLKLADQVGFFTQPSYTIRRQSPVAAERAAASSSTTLAGADSWLNSAWLNSGFAAPSTTNISDTTRMPTGTSEGRGDAERIDFEGENHYRMTRGSYTTCTPGNDDWYLRTQDLKLDYDREVADGSDGTLYFKEVPIFYSPWISFALNNARKSGLLAPSYGTSSNNGATFALPYYWNIAPNMDATITPTVLSKRGVVLGSEVRYLNNAFGGTYNSQLRADVLPNDRLRDGDTRYELSLQHNQTLANGWSGTVNYNKVSDDNYYTDLSTSLTSTSQVNLLQQGTLSYGGGGWWNATANVQSYQTLQPDSSAVNGYPYRMLPQITVNARQPDFYQTDSVFLGQYTNFTKPEQTINGVKTTDPDGQRTVLYPQVSLPYVTPGWYVTPKIGVNVSNYVLSGQAAGVPDTISRTLPIFSVDSGMTFERPSSWFGRDYTQTLEPRLYYLNVPYKDQSQIPVFDTGLADFNFAQIFSENQFSSWDRISNANQLTVAATSRLLEPDTGNEIARAMFGQRYYFEQSKVLLPGATADTEKWEKSAWLAAFSGQVLPKVYVDSALQYDGADRQADRFSIGTRYQPDPGKVLNLAYRYNRSTTTPIDQVDFSGQWPISGGWHGVGRINYSFKDDASNSGSTTQNGRLIEAVGGLEYNGGCWLLRGVVQRIATTESSASTGLFVQLELSDFSRIGSSPLDILKKSVQGYSLINQPAGGALPAQ